MKSRVKGDFQARFRENAGVKFPCVTRLKNEIEKSAQNGKFLWLKSGIQTELIIKTNPQQSLINIS